MTSVARIREDSSLLRELHARIGETYRLRERGPEQWAKWELACADFHHRFDKLCYPGGAAELDKLKSGDSSGIESAILFLEADPRHFRSAYTKEYLWRTLSRFPLSSADRERLQGAALAYPDRQMGREYWYMCRAITRIASDKFWTRVQAQADSDVVLVARRASYLLAFRAGLNAGVKVQQQVRRNVLSAKHGSG